MRNVINISLALMYPACKTLWPGSFSDTPKEVFWISSSRVCGEEAASFGGVL